MSLRVELQVNVTLTKSEHACLSWIEKALIAAAKIEEEENTEVSVQIVDDSVIQELNKEFRNIDRPTDVLSFPQWEPDEERFFLQGESIPLGDIVISMPKAKHQSAELGHSLERELAFLSVHGFLHLLGFDHRTPDESKKMFAKQEEILNQIGLKR